MKMEARKRARKKSIDNRQFLIAISESNFEELSTLLKIIDINFKDQDGCTPLHWAVETGNIKIIDILLKQGAHVHSKNNNHETPIDIAKQINRLDIINILESSLNANTTDKPNVTEITKTALFNKEHKTLSLGYDIWINPIHGYIYQLKVLMLFLHRALSCQYYFRIGTEIREAKKFDDLVFEYMHGNKKVYRLLQAKHKIDESKKITVDNLLTDVKGDYSLVKYFHSFQACKKSDFFKNGIIKDVIICTNIDFDFSDLKKSKIDLIKVKEKDDILDIKSDEKEPARYRFTNSIVKRLKSKLKQVVSDDEIEKFLKHLVFAVNQPNEEELGQIVKNEIGSEMGFLDTEIAYNKLLVKMMDLMLGKRHSMFLSHEEGKAFFNDLKKEMPIWFNIQYPVVSFTGRSEYLKNMHKILNKNYVCVSGMGGVGKSELARKYVAEYGHEYGNQIVWINAECYQTAAESFRQLASNKLNISLNSSDGKEKHIAVIVTDVYQFFSKDKSLFIFDNAEKYKGASEFDCGVDQFLPHLSKDSIKPYVIITSRNQKWPKSIETIVLKPFKAEEARELVEKVLTIESETEKGMIVDLCNKLQSLPLALQQAVSYINMQKEKLSCVGSAFGIGDYLERYSSMACELLDSEFPEDSDSNYNKSVFATWNITFDALKQKEHGNDALYILNIISYFLPDNIPIELLLIFLTDKVKLSSAIGLLKQFSIVNVQHKALSIHRLVQQVTRIKLQRQNNEVKILQNTLKLLSEDNINDKNVDHVVTMWSYAKKHKKLLQVYCDLTNDITRHFFVHGRIHEAYSIAVELLKMVNTLPKDNIHNQIRLLYSKNILGQALLHKGEYQAALKIFQEIQEAEQTIPERSVNEYLSVKMSIAQTLIRLGRYKEALVHYNELLDANKGTWKSDHPEILKIKNDISHILLTQGKFEDSLLISEELYQVQKAALGENHPNTLFTRNNIATALGKMNRFDEALVIWKEIYSMRESTLPKGHPAIVDIQFNIASGLLAQNKPNSAFKIFQELRDIQSKKYGEDHHETMSIDIYIATILGERGEYEKALKIFRNAFDVMRTSLGPKHPETFRAQEGLGDVLVRQKNFKDAYEIYEDYLDKITSTHGNNHKITFEVRKTVVNILVELKIYDEALKRALETLDTAESIYGKNHPSTFFYKRNLGWLYCYNKDFDRALVTMAQLLQVKESYFGKNHVDCQDTREDILIIQQEKNEFESQRNTKNSIVINNELLTVIKNGDVVRLKQFLKEVTNINVKDAEGRTLLHHASNVANERTVAFLLDREAKIFVTTNMGNTPLHIAVSKNKVNIVKLLLQKIEPERLNDFVDAKTASSASTALHVAAKMGSHDIVKHLLKNHATFCATNKDGKTPLDLSDDAKIMKLLRMVHESFEIVTKADHANEIVGKLATLPLEEFLAVTNTRNDRGSTLSQVAILNKQKFAATQILQMMQKLNLK